MKLASLPVRAVAARVCPAVVAGKQEAAEVGRAYRPVAGEVYRPEVEVGQVYRPKESLSAEWAYSSQRASELVRGCSLAQDRFDLALASSPERPSPGGVPSVKVM